MGTVTPTATPSVTAAARSIAPDSCVARAEESIDSEPRRLLLGDLERVMEIVGGVVLVEEQPGPRRPRVLREQRFSV